MKIIALYSGRPQMGKSTAQNFLATHGYERVSFAASLRVACAAILMDAGCPQSKAIDILSSLKNEPCRQLGGATGRDMLIAVGQAMRSVSPTWWIDAALSRCKTGGKYVIDDLRFPNEFDALKARGAILVRIAGDRGIDGIAGEGQLDDREFDFVIGNFKTTSLNSYEQKLELLL